MKIKPVSNLQEKCDEWLSTRNKKKVSKPSPSIKRNLATTTKLWKLTQNSPPPPQLFSSTKQSVLMSFFNKAKIEDNRPTNDEDISDDFDPDYGDSEEQPLTNQFRFLSQDEHQPMEDNVLKLKQRNQEVKGDIQILNIGTDGDNCRHNSSNLNICDNNTTDSDIEFVSGRLDASNEIMQSPYHKTKSNETDDNSDLEFISQRNYSMGKNSRFAKTFQDGKCDKFDSGSEIEFMSQRFNGERLQEYSGTAKHKKNEDCRPSDIEFSSKRTSLHVDDDYSDIEFFSQKVKKNPKDCNQLSVSKICDNVKRGRNMVKNPCLSLNIQHCVNNNDVNFKSKSNSVMKERGKTIFCPRLTEENTDIEFVSQTVVEKEIEAQRCQRETLCKTKKSETENSSVDSENSSDINSDSQTSLNEKCENRENTLFKYRPSSLKSTTKSDIGCSELRRQKVNEDDRDVDKVCASRYKSLQYYRKFKNQSSKSKGDKSSKFANKFYGKQSEFQELPDTIKFTDSETDSDEIMSGRLLMVRSGQNKRYVSEEPDSIVFTLGDM